MDKIIQECAMFVPVEAQTMEQMNSYVKERSDNIKIIAEMFKLDSVNGTLNETGTRMTIKSGDIKLDVPVEKVINMQYADLLNIRKTR